MPAEPTTEKPLSAAWASLLTAIPLVAIGVPILLGQAIFVRDPARWNTPARGFVADALRRGESPWWNPRQWLGLPVSSNPLYGLGYPPNWVAFLAPNGTIPWVLSALWWLHLAGGALGLGLLARRLGASPAGAAVGALAWSLSGQTLSLWTAGILLPAVAWLPWVGLALVVLADDAATAARPTAVAGRVAGAALCVGLALLHGEVFVAGMAVGFGLVTALVKRPAAWRRTVPAVLAAAVLGTAIGGLTVIPTRAGVDATPRAAGLSLDEAQAYSLHPWRLVEFAAPHAFGVPESFYPAGAVIGEPTIDGAPLAHHVYLGAVALALMAISLSRRDRTTLVFAALIGVCLVVSLGRHTPVHGALYLALPPMRWMRYPEKFLIPAIGWCSLLAALGASRASIGRRDVARIAALAAVLAAVAAAVTPPAGGVAFTLRVGAVGALLRLPLLALALGLRARRPRAGEAVLVLLVGCDLAIEALPHLRFTPSALHASPPPVVAVINRDRAARGNDAPVPARVYRSGNVGRVVGRLPLATPAESERAQLDSLIPNNAAMYGVAIVPGYDAVVAPTLLSLWQHNLNRGVALLRLFAVEYALLPTPAEGPERPGYTALTQPLPGVTLYRVNAPLPRVFVATRALPADGQTGRDALFSPAVLEGREVRVDGSAPLPTEPTEGRCAFRSFETGRIEARCTLSAPGVVVFVEQSDPGWKAEVDGHPTEVRTANAVLRGVVVPAGEHTVRLRFEPRGVPSGAVMTLLGLVVTAGLFARWRHGRATERTAPG